VSRKIICTAFSAGKCHDFRLFKESKTHIHPDIQAETDTGFTGIAKIHANSVLPKKSSKKNPLSKEDKAEVSRDLCKLESPHELIVGKNCWVEAVRYS